MIALMPDVDPLKRLREIRDELELLEGKTIVLRAGRDSLIREAASHRYSHRKIAKAAGLTRARVGQILDE